VYILFNHMESIRCGGEYLNKHSLSFFCYKPDTTIITRLIHNIISNWLSYSITNVVSWEIRAHIFLLVHLLQLWM
jgi:hypothetical protein